MAAGVRTTKIGPERSEPVGQLISEVFRHGVGWRTVRQRDQNRAASLEATQHGSPPCASTQSFGVIKKNQ
jgi:hypothetical protein